ncbi:hypothetical protein Tco_1308647 [Tanacetum coccineum]
MLDRADFTSWKQCIRLYCRGKENGVKILKSIDKGPFQMRTFQETLVEGNEGALHLGPERARVYSDLSPDEKDRYNADIWATNILLQGLPKDIYTLINHYPDAKDIWDNVKMLMEGSELTKEGRESQLFTKLINDMRKIKMTMPIMQLNSKFVNNMLPECGRFVTVVKLNKGLKELNYDQLYAYLKQHEAHTNENKMMLERFTQHMVNPLPLMSNVSPQQYSSQSSTTQPSTYVPPVTYQPYFANNTKLDSGLSPMDNLIKNLTNTLALTQSYKIYLPQTNNQLRTSSNTRNQATVQDDRENGVVLDEEKLLFLAADKCDAFDLDVDEAPTAQTMFMENLSLADPVYDEAGPSYDSNILSEVHEYDNYQDAVFEHHDAHEMHHDVQPNYVVDSNADYTSDSNMILYDQYVKDNAEPVVQSNVSSVPNDAYMMIINEMHEQTSQSVSANEQNKVVNASLTDVLKVKAKALKEQTTASRPIKALTVYPPNTPATLVSRVLPTKRERGFEQTKECYLTEVIPFFKTLKEHFEGIQKALTKEIKEMKEIFEELEAEVDQNVVNRKYDAIERKNLLIANDNLIVGCFPKKCFILQQILSLLSLDSLKYMMPTLLFKHVV